MASGDRRNTSPSSGDGSQSRSSRLKKRAAKKASSGSSKKKMTQTEQSARFIETARTIGAIEGDDAFDDAVSRILSNVSRKSADQ